MEVKRQKILVWLPGPMGDAVLSTSALRSIRRRFSDCSITFLASKVVREILTPGQLNDQWLELKGSNPFETAKILRKEKFDCAILFKNSIASALACFLAAIPSRVGYAREGRGLLLTEKLHPPRETSLRFKPRPMTDYYLAIASWLGGETVERSLELSVDPQNKMELLRKIPELQKPDGPVVVLVPGGAFGPSKCWNPERFAATADLLIENYKATVVISVSPNAQEQKISRQICEKSKHRLINLSETPVTPGQLKSLFSSAELVITNDTGPRHIAIALRRKLVTLFGPNSPDWTETGYENEIKIIGNAPCAPCAKPVCSKIEHYCMNAISVAQVYKAAVTLLENKPLPEAAKKMVESAKGFFADPEYIERLEQEGLDSFEGVFSFYKGENLHKRELAAYRTRMRIEIQEPPVTLFLKRYDNPPLKAQINNWISHRRRQSMAFSDVSPCEFLKSAGIDTPKIIAHGTQWNRLFEKRSFCVTEKIAQAESLERKLPDCFTAAGSKQNVRNKKEFINNLAEFVKKFHQTGYRHRDFYLAHIFYDGSGRFHLIDLARAFRPRLFAERFRRKDIAELYYSSPARYVSRTDRMRFYKAMTGSDRLNETDKIFIRKIVRKAERMARHDLRRGKTAPFASR